MLEQSAKFLAQDICTYIYICEGTRVSLAYSRYVSNPMLIDVFRPVVILPELAFVQNGMGGELKNILCHELTHYRRKDILYKWLVMAVTSVHWLNPLMFLMRNEISRTCELSCDEAVIRGMSVDEKTMEICCSDFLQTKD